MYLAAELEVGNVRVTVDSLFYHSFKHLRYVFYNHREHECLGIANLDNRGLLCNNFPSLNNTLFYTNDYVDWRNWRKEVEESNRGNLKSSCYKKGD